MLHKKATPDSKPCRHMRGLLQARQEGKLSGLARWYTESHVAQCPHCRVSPKTAPAEEAVPAGAETGKQSHV